MKKKLFLCIAVLGFVFSTLHVNADTLILNGESINIDKPNPVNNQQISASYTLKYIDTVAPHIAKGRKAILAGPLAARLFVIRDIVDLNTSTVPGTNAKVIAVKLKSGSVLMALPANLEVDVRQLLRLKLVIDSLNYDDIVIGFSAGATAAYNGMEDSRYLEGINAPEGLSSFSADSNPVQLAINFLPLPKLIPDVIRLNVAATYSGPFSLERTELDELPKLYEVWLMDSYKKDSLDLRNNDNYPFAINKNDTASFGGNRFRVVVKQNPALGVHLLDFTAVQAIGGVPITWKTENEENYTNFTVERSIDNGLTFIALDTLTSTTLGAYSYMDANPVNTVGSYRLKLQDLNGTLSYSKTITIGTAAIAVTKMNIYPNPASDVINLAITSPDVITNGTPVLHNLNFAAASNIVPASSYAIKIINIMGSVMQSSNTTTGNWQTSVTNLSPGTYFIQVVDNANSRLVGKSKFIKL